MTVLTCWNKVHKIRRGTSNLKNTKQRFLDFCSRRRLEDYKTHYARVLDSEQMFVFARVSLIPLEIYTYLMRSITKRHDYRK